MIIKIPNLITLNQKKYLVVDTDTFEMIENRINSLRIYPNEICIRNRTNKKIPIWRLVRRCFDKRFTIVYKDGDKYNLQRENLLLKRI